MRTYDQVKHTVDVLGQIAGNPDKAKTLIQDMDNKNSRNKKTNCQMNINA